MPLFQINFLKIHFLYLSPTMLYPWGSILGFVTPRIRDYPTPKNKKISVGLLVGGNKITKKVLQKPKHTPITNIFQLKRLTTGSFISRVALNFSIQRFWRHGMVVTSGLVDKINTVIAVRRLISSSSWCVPSTKEKYLSETSQHCHIYCFTYLWRCI